MKLYQWLLLVLGLFLLATLTNRTPEQTAMLVAAWSIGVPLLVWGYRFIRREVKR